MTKILVVHGPNLQLLGTRQPKVYGRTTLREINQRLAAEARRLKVTLEFLQSNHEGAIVEAIGQARGLYAGILINPAAYTHTSVAIRDAIEAAALPTVEVHLSNIAARETFRQTSLVAPVVVGYQAWTYWVFRRRVSAAHIPGAHSFLPAVAAKALIRKD